MHVTRILIDPSAKGVYFFNRFRKQGKWRVADKPESEWGRVECEPIVPEALWSQVNQIIETQLKSWKRRGRLPVQVFGNLAHCSCGGKMYVRSNSPKYVCRKCQNKIPIADLEAIFQEEMKAFFARPERIAEHLQSATKNLTEKEIMLSAHEREIQKVRDAMTRTHQLYLDGGITVEGFREFYMPVEQRLNQLKAELPKLQAEMDLLRVNNLSADEVLSEAQGLYDRWPKLPTEDKRKIAESIIEKVVIGDREIDITFSCLPSSEEMTKTQQQLRGPG